MAATASTHYRRMFLRTLRESARRGGGTLADALLAAGVGRIEATATGMVVTSASANGHSYDFAVPTGSTLTPETLAEICSELLDLRDACNADLVAAGTASPTDDQLLTEMLGRLNPCDEYRPDFSAVSYQSGGYR